MILPIFLIVFAATYTNSLLANNLSFQKNPALPPLHHPEHQSISKQPVIPPEQDHAIPVKALSSKDLDSSGHQRTSTTQDQIPPLIHTSSKKNSDEILVDLEKPDTTSPQLQKNPSKKEVATNIILGGAGITGIVATSAGIVGSPLVIGIGIPKAVDVAQNAYDDSKYGEEPELPSE